MLTLLRAHGVTVVVEILVNVVLPYATYALTTRELGDTKALLASSVPPLLWSLAEFIRKRRIDALSLLVLGGIVLSLLAFLGGGSARFLQLRENFVSVFVAFVFLGSAAIRRPLIYELAKANLRRSVGSDAAAFEALRANVHFKRTMMLMTLVWGFGLLAAAGACCALLFVVSIGTYLILSPLITYGAMGAIGLWTFWFAGVQRRKGAARRAAELRSEA